MSIGCLDCSNYKELERDNFALAAGQCIVENGLLGDEYGNQYCDLQKQLTALREENERLREIETLARNYINAFKSYMEDHPRSREHFKTARSYREALTCILENSDGRD